MKVEGTFLSSRAGRRIFWTLLLAAAVPIITFGIAMYALLSSQFEAQVARQQVQLVKFAGMGLLDRLLVARTALTMIARSGRVDADADNRNGRVLLEVAQFDSRGDAIVGSRALVQRWYGRTSAWLTERGGINGTLMVGTGADATGARPVLLLLADPERRDRLWIAEVDPKFVFSELSADASGSRICVFEGPRSPVYCPGWDAADHVARPDDGPGVQWQLFLRSDFHVDDWTLVSMDNAAGTETDAAPLARLSALVAVTTLLFVGMLGLIQVRRTMVPLERLIAGTRRLSQHDYSARVHLRPGDEFGELARSFNHMAERIDHQMHAMQVQSSIDHEILNGLNVARVLQRVAQRLEQVVPGAAACVVEFDRNSRLMARVHAADTPLSIVGMPRSEAWLMADLPSNDIAPCDDPPPWLASFVRSPGGRLWLRCAKAGGDVLGLLVIAADAEAVDGADARREIAELCDRVSVALSSADRERRLLERATHDSLTGLANRAGLFEAIDALLAGERRQPFSLLFVDLDRFKEVNDSLGHHVGDELLRAVARRLEQAVPSGTVVARPGGDEFVVLVRGPRSAAADLAALLCAELARPVDLGGRTAAIGASIGMAHHPEHGATGSDLMRRADMAMYSAKARGGGEAAWFEPALDVRATERAALLTDLRHAQARGELELHYQPRIHARAGIVTCAEALLRWRHPTRGLVPPAVYITLMEETGLIDTVGLWVIEQAVAQLARWRVQGVALESIAVNLSTRQLQSPHLPDRVEAILARHGLRASDLELEITESIFVGDNTLPIATLRQLHATGVRIALDDFGTGYSSLAYLHKLPIQVIKVDRSFVVELGQRDSALALTRSIVALARALNLRIVAEGVETQRQVDLLSALGCDELQGWLYAPALEPAAFARFVARPVASVSALAT